MGGVMTRMYELWPTHRLGSDPDTQTNRLMGAQLVRCLLSRRMPAYTSPCSRSLVRPLFPNTRTFRLTGPIAHVSRAVGRVVSKTSEE